MARYKPMHPTHPMNSAPCVDASDIRLDPWLHLAAAVTVRAVYDLRAADLMKALDALGWWLSDGPLWLDALGISDDPDCVFVLLEKLDDEQRLPIS